MNIQRLRIIITCNIPTCVSVETPYGESKIQGLRIPTQHSWSYLLTPWCRDLLEQLTGLQLVKKFPVFHGTRRFITALTSARHLSILGQPIQSIVPHPTSWRFVLILSTHVHLGLPSGRFLSGFPTKNLYTPLFSPLWATCPFFSIFITRTILDEEYKSFSSSLCSLLHFPVTSSLLGPNILLNTLFSITVSFLFSRNVSDQVSHPYKTIGKIIFLYILIFKFLDSNLEDKRFCTEWHQAFPDLNLLLISSIIEFWFVKVVPKYLNSSTLSKVLLSVLTPILGVTLIKYLKCSNYKITKLATSEFT